MTPAESEAENLVSDLGLSLPIKPKLVCHEISTAEHKVNYREELLTTPGVCGISISHGDQIEVVVNSEISNPGRKKFTGFHEVGHVLLHIFTGKQSAFTCSELELSSNGNNQAFEKEANEFASALLMPRSLIGNKVSRNDLSWSLIDEISADTGASLEAAARRLVSISQDQCALVIHKDNVMWTPTFSSSFKTYIDTTPFPSNLVTFPDMRGTLPDEMGECDATDFILNPRGLPNAIRYCSIRNEEFDRTMTLLLVEEEELDVEDDDWEEPHF